MLWYILVFVIIILLLRWYFNRNHDYWKKRGVKHLEPWPLVGNALDVFLHRKPLAYDTQYKYNTFYNEKYYGTYMFGRPFLVVKDPELIKQIAIKDFENFVDRSTLLRNENAESFFAKNLFALTGKRWKNMRSTLSPAFTSSKMKTMFELMCVCGDEMVTHLRKKIFTGVDPAATLSLDMKEFSSRFSNDVIATCALGIKCESLDNDNEIYMNALSATHIPSTRIFLVNVVPRIMKFLGEGIVPKSSTNYFRKMLTNTLKVREEKDIVRQDVINILIQSRKGSIKHEKNTAVETGFATIKETSIDLNEKNKFVLSDEDVAAQAFIYLFAGFDTTSTILSFASYELARNPNVQKKLQEEVDKINDESGGKITYDLLFKMKYMDMVVSESLRMWPSASFLDRMCTTPYKIQTEDGVLLLEKGITVNFPVYALHRDPKYYPNPDQFDPERFSVENKHKIDQGTFLTFGIGPRGCIGSRFALMEIKIFLFYILTNFDIVTTSKTPIPMILATGTFRTQAKDGCWVGLKLRVH